MSIIFLTNLYPKEQEQEIRSKMSMDMNDAANVLQWNLVSGLEQHIPGQVTLINNIPIDSWPKRYKDPIIKRSYFAHTEKANDVNPAFCNVTMLKQFIVGIPFAREVIKVVKERKKKELVLLCYSLKPMFLKAIRKAKRSNKEIRGYAIVADLPQFTVPSGNFINKAFAWYAVSTVQRNLKYIDGFILLTEQMAEKMNIHVPYIVMEGIAPDREIALRDEDDGFKTIFYSGSMNYQYGISVLLKAFTQIKDKNYRLVLCGLGNAESEIIQYVQKDSRIQFLGKVPHSELFALQDKATVLVNPRQNIEEFTKYSFPSKTMEYLAAGIPVVVYKLDGIPDEYDDYLFYVEDNSAEALAQKLVEVCSMPAKQREEAGAKAAKFVKLHKNAVVQTKRIIEFIES